MRRRHLLALGLLPAWPVAQAGVAQCVVPSKAGGGFDLTCQLTQSLLAPAGAPPRLVYQPGGIGALTYSEVVRGGRPEPQELVAFSSGTLLNIAQGRFGPWRPERIRWVAALAQDHGVVAVHRDAPWRTLAALLTDLRRQPSAVAFAAGGTIGSQDWMKAALLARSAGVSHKQLRCVAFEGGGDALQALQGRHVQVLCGDVAELMAPLAQGLPVRLLATLAPARLPGRLADVPTAVEQGVDLRWPILRGVYAPADYPAAPLALALAQLETGLHSPAHAARVQALGMQPLALTGAPLEREVNAQLAHYQGLAQSLGLTALRPPGS